MLTVTLLSLGVPMILMGDEVRRTQAGTTTPTATTTRATGSTGRWSGGARTCCGSCACSSARRMLRDETHERQRVSLTEMLRHARTAWHGVKLLRPDWSPQSHSLAFGAEMRREGMELPSDHERVLGARSTSNCRTSPIANRGGDGSTPRSTRPTTSSPWQGAGVDDLRAYRVGPRSVVVLWRRLGDECARIRLTDTGSVLMCDVLALYRRSRVRRRGSAGPPLGAAQAAPRRDALGRDTPRGTVLGFMNAAREARDEVAPQYLNTDLRDGAAVELAHQALRGPRQSAAGALARAQRSAGRVAGQPLKPNQDIVGTITTADGTAGPRPRARQAVARQAPVWLFSRETLDAHSGRVRRSRSRGGRSVSSGIPDQAAHRRHPSVRVAGALADRPSLLSPDRAARLAAPSVHRRVAPPSWIRSDAADQPRARFRSAPADRRPIRWLLGIVEMPLFERVFWSGIATSLAIVGVVWPLF